MDWDTIEELAHDVESKDSCTAAHTVRVALYAQALAEAAGLREDRVRRIMQGAVVHDIGKIDIPESILRKPGRLTDEEFAVMRQHTVRGHERLISMGVDDPMILELVRWHHERMDGTGYPDRIRGAEIPMPARYFAVIDCFDALTSIRPYRQEIGADAAERAITELKAHVDTWYYRPAVEQFEQLYRTGALDWILHHLNDAADLGRNATRREVLAFGSTLRQSREPSA